MGENLPGADSPGPAKWELVLSVGRRDPKEGNQRHRTNQPVQLHDISVANNEEQREWNLVPEGRQWGEFSSSWTRSGNRRRRVTSPHGSLSIEHNIKQALHCVPNVSVPDTFSILQRFALEYPWPRCLNQQHCDYSSLKKAFMESGRSKHNLWETQKTATLGYEH